MHFKRYSKGSEPKFSNIFTYLNLKKAVLKLLYNKLLKRDVTRKEQ